MHTPLRQNEFEEIKKRDERFRSDAQISAVEASMVYADRKILILELQYMYKKYEDTLAALNVSSATAFLEGVNAEAAKQRATNQATGIIPPNDTDWFWLIGFHAGKAVGHIPRETKVTAVYAAAATCLNWYLAITERFNKMQPGPENTR